MQKYIKYTIYSFITACMLLFCELAFAQPANDDICSATTLLLDGSCLTGQATSGATSDYYGGCVSPGNPSVWYTFTVTAPNDYLTINITSPIPAGSEVQAFLMEGTCTAPSGISVQCELTPIIFKFYNITPGTYFIMISTQPGVGNELTSFSICATQSIAPPLAVGPEQDCYGALPVCNQIYTQNLSYTDFWDTDEIPDGTTCLFGGENNSVWYVFTAQANGDLSFMINTVKDYDWALYNLTSIGGCAAIPTSTPVLCNYSDDNGNTGTTLPVNAAIPRSVGWNGAATMPGIPVTAGTTYVLIVDNWTGDANGYTIDFGTSAVVDVTKPFMTSAAASCTDNTIMITMNEEIKCLTVSQNDFILTNTTTGQNFTSAITQILGYGCGGSGGYATQLQITHDGTLTSGVYQITINANPVLADKCDNIINAGSTINFNYLAPIIVTSDKTNNAICSSIAVTLTTALSPDGNPDPAITYTLNPGAISNGTGVFIVTPAITTLYTISAVMNLGSCTRTTTITITLETVVASISPMNPTICPGTTILTASGTGGIGPYTFAWNGGYVGTSNPTPAIGAGTYNVTVTSAAGCTSTQTSIVTIASPGGGTNCNVFYVSPAGAGDCLTKATPGSLTTALGLAVCNNGIIQMQTGIYPFTDKVNIGSYVTIEGGFNATFTIKTSNMASGSATTIQRSNIADSDDGTSCSVFKVVAGATAFRFQDIRIELPGSPNVAALTNGSGISNYGIKMGAGCTSYSIVRCYIDAGVGANP